MHRLVVSVILVLAIHSFGRWQEPAHIILQAPEGVFQYGSFYKTPLTMTPRLEGVAAHCPIPQRTRIIPDAHRFIGSGRTVAETTSPRGGRQFSLRGSLDIKRSFSGTETFAIVRGEKLSLASSTNGIVPGLAQDLTHEP